MSPPLFVRRLAGRSSRAHPGPVSRHYPNAARAVSRGAALSLPEEGPRAGSRPSCVVEGSVYLITAAGLSRGVAPHALGLGLAGLARAGPCWPILSRETDDV